LGPCRGYITRACRETDKTESKVVVRQLLLGGGVGGGGIPNVVSSCVATPNENVEDLARDIMNRIACSLAERL
jgi:hypothetical protein